MPGGLFSCAGCGPMIYENPTDEVLWKADSITLIDPRVPGWAKQLVTSLTFVFPTAEHEYVHVEIPVDSTNQSEFDFWYARMVKAKRWDEEDEELARLRKEVDEELEIELEKLRQLGDEYWSTSRPNDL